MSLTPGLSVLQLECSSVPFFISLPVIHCRYKTRVLSRLPIPFHDRLACILSKSYHFSSDAIFALN